TLVQTTTTGAAGAYKFELGDADLEANSVWYVRSHGARSMNRKIRVAPQITFEGPPEGTQILTGVANKVTFTGKVTPATDIGALVVLQRQNALTGNHWTRIGASTVEPGGTYSLPHAFIVPGDANLRVAVLSRGHNAPAFSSLLSYEISQAQNKTLTIEANPDPISYGQSMTIGGTLTGATSSQTVTLLARTVRQHGFAQVAQVSTSTTGVYTFPAQTPLNSTFYRVESDGRASAVLFEGVKYVVSAQASTTATLQGQIVTFSGKVEPTPLRPEHVIYLERQNASGSGFHIVREATVGAGGTYSIPYQVANVGNDVFRVYIPGGPDNGGAASPLITVKVSPAPAAALKEVPGNSTSPGEGGTTTTEVEREGEERGEAGTSPEEAPPHGHGHHRV
ncbi:MAG TPA: hypothetical protein VNV37_02195, partial [Solirubrobacteraceae bacterium]|nr:hypothetical protein [Solirubrobacteraceae bacterium]